MARALALLAAAVLCGFAAAECPNGCSGHGLCRSHDQCVCEAGYFGADCSLRICPHDYAFVDIPAGDLNHNGLIEGSAYVQTSSGKAPTSNVPAYEMFPTDAAAGGFAAQQDEAHFYMECSGKGDCDRAAGECKCYDGYTGSACQRSTCPNDCSGHGLCRTLKEVASGALSRRAVGSQGGNLILTGVRSAFDYSLWDADKHQMCVCDAGFEGIDCSQRTCPRGDDPLTPSDARWCGGSDCQYEVQQFRLSSAGPTTYRFGFMDLRNNSLVAYATVDTATGVPGAVADPVNNVAGPTTNAGIIMEALRSVPGGQLQLVEVRAMSDDLSSVLSRTFQVTFTGLSGNQYMLDLQGAGGQGRVELAPTEVARGNTEDIECSGRGLCDRENGLCKCFGGYYGMACEFQNALSMGAASTSSAAGKSA